MNINEAVTLTFENDYSIKWLNKSDSFNNIVNNTVNNLLDSKINFNKANDIVSKSLNERSKLSSINNYKTRAQSKLYDKIEISILKFDTGNVDELLLILASIYPDINKYFKKLIGNSIDNWSVSIKIEHNSITIKGNVCSIFNILLSGTISNIIAKCNNKNLSLSQFQNNVRIIPFKNDLSNTSCSICLDNLKKSNVIVETSCKHRFHYHCLFTWLCKECSRPECPCCRKLQLVDYK